MTCMTRIVKNAGNSGTQKEAPMITDYNMVRRGHTNVSLTIADEAQHIHMCSRIHASGVLEREGTLDLNTTTPDPASNTIRTISPLSPG